jgi:hypothetical protein
LPHAEAVRTCHELLYQKVAAEERARLEAKCREAARLPPVASSAPDLMSLARAYVDPLVVVVPDERVKIRPQSLEGLRAALEQARAKLESLRERGELRQIIEAKLAGRV